ncbi:MAG: ferritin family protein [Oligoflexales bacterium]|nr:ferritin family protein [Oligoflexales bacterium]
MNLFDIAMNREQSICDFYRKLSRQMPDRTGQELLLRLADQENRHLEKVADLKNLLTHDFCEDFLIDDKFLNNWPSWEREWLDLNMGFKPEEILKKAYEFEVSSKHFYEVLLTKAQSPELKEILRMMADEENTHIDMIAGMIQNLS